MRRRAGMIRGIHIDPPTAPAIAGVVSGKNIVISLTTASTSRNGPITGYTLYYSIAGAAGPWTFIATLLPGQFPYTWTGTNPSTSYWFIATATDSLNLTSALSNAPGPLTTPAGSGTTILNGPTLGTCLIGGAQTYPAAAVTYMSKAKIAIINGNFDTAPSSFGRTRAALVSAIQSASTVGTIVAQYDIADYVDSAGASGGNYRGDVAWGNKVVAQNWLAYTSGSSGTKVINFFNASWWQTDSALFCTPDANGDQLEAAFAKNQITKYITGGTSNAAPTTAALFHDNWFPVPRSNGDYNRDGSLDGLSNTSTMDNWQLGLAKYPQTARAVAPTLLVGGNFQIRPTTYMNPAFVGVLDYCLYESAIGQWYSDESVFGTLGLLTNIQTTQNALAGNKYVIIGHDKLNASGSDPIAWDASHNVTANSPNFQGSRYGAALSRMLDNLLWFPNSTYSADAAANLRWFDELGVNASTAAALAYPNVDAGLGWLGPANGAYTTLPSGVLMRDHQNGVALVNPRGNGVKTFTVPGGPYQKIAGQLETTVNSGAVIGSNPTVTMQDRDGLFLVKTSSAGFAGSTLLYSDDFETGTNGSTITGTLMNWAPNLNDVAGSTLTYSRTQAFSGLQSIAFKFGGTGSLCELDFDLGAFYKEVMFEYYYYVPANYKHGASGSSNNNKFMRIGPNNPPSAGVERYGFSTERNTDQISDMAGEWDTSSDGSNMTANSISPNFITPADYGTWLKIRWYCKAATAKTTGPGILQMWRNDVLFIDQRPDSYVATGLHAFRYGYLLGAVNAVYNLNTVFYIDKMRVWVKP